MGVDIWVTIAIAVLGFIISTALSGVGMYVSFRLNDYRLQQVEDEIRKIKEKQDNAVTVERVETIEARVQSLRVEIREELTSVLVKLDSLVTRMDSVGERLSRIEGMMQNGKST